MEPDKATRIYICLNEMIDMISQIPIIDQIHKELLQRRVKYFLESQSFKETKSWLEGKK
jgi:hypothetical protein